MNYGGFGAKKDAAPEASAATGPSDAQKPMNYGGFGKRREEAKPEGSSPSLFGGSKFGGFQMPGASTVYGNKANFNPLDQFRSSMLQVLNAGLKPAEDYERIYRNSLPCALPS